jgi:hypothetical protein
MALLPSSEALLDKLLNSVSLAMKGGPAMRGYPNRLVSIPRGMVKHAPENVNRRKARTRYQYALRLRVNNPILGTRQFPMLYVPVVGDVIP